MTVRIAKFRAIGRDSEDPNREQVLDIFLRRRHISGLLEYPGRIDRCIALMEGGNEIVLSHSIQNIVDWIKAEEQDGVGE